MLATMRKDRWAGYEAVAEGTVETVPVKCDGANLFMWWINGTGGWSEAGPKTPSVLIWPDAPQRTNATNGVYMAAGFQSNLCMVIHTLHTPHSEVPANMVVVRLARGVAPNGQRSTPGEFTSQERSRFLRLLGDALLPKPPQGRAPETRGKADREPLHRSVDRVLGEPKTVELSGGDLLLTTFTN